MQKSGEENDGITVRKEKPSSLLHRIKNELGP
jgi:hypothetical protein